MHFIYPPTLDWTFLFQRPQQLAVALSRLGHTFIFCQKTQRPGQPPTAAPGFLDLPGLRLVHDWPALRATLGPEHVLLASWAKYHTECGRAGLTVFDSLDAFGQWAELEREMVQKADVVVCTSQAILVDTQPRRSDTVDLLRNACDPDHWLVTPRQSQSTRAPAPSLAARGPFAAPARQRVLFSGYVGSWVDDRLLAEVVRAMPDVDFVVVGPRTLGLSRIRGANVKALGEVGYAELPALFAGCRVGLIPFKTDDPVAIAADPIKVYEYLAAGLGVVSTPIPEVVRWGDHVRVARTANEFVREIRAALAEADEPGRSARQAAVATHTWEARARALVEIIAARVQGRPQPPVRAEFTVGAESPRA